MPRKKPSQPLAKETSSDKVDSLQALNVLLVKETMETREQMKNLQTCMAELSVDLDYSLRAGIDHTVALTVLESEAEEEKKQRCKLERRLKEMEAVQSGLQAELGEAESFKESEGKLAGDVKRLEVEIELARKEEEGKSMRAEELESKNAELLEEIGRLNVDVANLVEDKGTTERHFKVVKEELIGRKVELQKKLEMVVGERDQLLGKNGELCNDIGFLKMKETEKTMRMKELERMNEDLKVELAKLRAEIDAHGEETGERETKFEVAKMMLVGKGGELERKVEELTKEKEGIWKKNGKLQGDMASWKKKDETNSLRISELEREKKELSDIADLLRGAAEVISLTVAELEEKNAEFQAEIGRLDMKLVSVHEENEKKERRFDLGVGDVVEELQEKADVHRMNGKPLDEFNVLKQESEAKQKALNQLEAKNKELAEKVQKLAVELEEKEEEEKRLLIVAEVAARKMGELERKAMELEEDRDRMETGNAALRDEIGRLNLELNKHAQEKRKRETSFKIAAEELEQGIKELRRQVEVETKDKDGAEKKGRELRNEIEMLRVVLKEEIEEREEKEKGFEASCHELTQQVEELKWRTKATTEEKEGLSQAKAEREAEIRRLGEEIDRLSSSTVPRLHKTAADQAEEIKALRAEKVELRKAFDKQKMLRKQMKEVQKDKESANKEARRLECEKAKAEDDLTAVQRKLQETEQRARTASTLYPRALAMVKSSAKAMRRGGAVDDQPKRSGMGDREMRPFVSELESVRRSYRKRGEDVEATRREVRVLQVLVGEAKTKVSIWVLTASVTSAIAVLALAACAANRLGSLVTLPYM